MKARYLPILFLGFWLVLSLWQACFAQLIPDEAYYWLYSQNLAWGYFDHPPAVALMIKAGDSLFHNEFGVRLFAVLLSGASLILIYKTVKPENDWLFIAIISCILPFQILTNYAVPDVPLLFFCTLFFLAFRPYILSEGKNRWWLILLAIIGMLYSKYHAVLVVFFTILAVPEILKFRSFWFIFLVSCAAYVPHINWQITHDFASLNFYLHERDTSPWSINTTLDYLSGQLLMLGPLSALPFIYAVARHKSKNKFERVLWFNLLGIFTFFFIMSWRRHTEPNWTIPFLPPLVILSYTSIREHPALQRFMRPAAWVSLFIVLLVKEWLTAPFTDKKWFKADCFHGWKTWAAEIKELAGQTPVVFMNSYHEPSEYMFYTGGQAFSVNGPYARKNQYNYWHYDEPMMGKKAILVSSEWYEYAGQVLPTSRDTVKYKWVNEFYSFGKMRIIPLNSTKTVRAGEQFELSAVIKDEFIDKSIIQKLAAIRPDISYIFLKDKWFMPPAKTGKQFELTMLADTLHLSLTAPPVSGDYSLQFCFEKPGQIILASNSKGVALKVLVGK